MKHEELKDLMITDCCLINSGSDSLIFELKNGSILKMFNRNGIQSSKYIKNPNNYIFVKELKVKMAYNFQKFNEVIIPETIVYDNNDFMGYTMKKNNDKTFIEIFNESYENQTIETISNYFYKLEKIVKKGNEQGIVFPDLLTYGNVRYNHKTDDIILLDYDGFQIKNLPTWDMCSLLHPKINQCLFHKKYLKQNRFTNNIDKLSIAVGFLLFATNFNIANHYSKIDKSREINLILDFIGLDDNSVRYKILKLFNNKEDNEYLEEDLLRIADMYRLEQHNEIPKYRKFVKKR
ncbi:MAG: hypothetical protein WDA12_02765 [Bacilli bacterium]